MRNFLLVLVLITCGLVTQAQSTWKSPSYQASAYRKVIVLAKISDEMARRQLEDATVKALQAKGIQAISSYQNISEADLTSEEAFIRKADELEVDALVLYTIKGVGNEYQNTPSVNASLGVPVRIGIFHGFLGGNVPLAGGTKTVQVVNATVSFYNRSSKDMQWSQGISGKLKKGSEKLANEFAKDAVKGLFKSGIFLKP